MQALFFLFLKNSPRETRNSSESGFPLPVKEGRIDFSVPPVIFPVVFSDAPQHPAGIAHRHHIGGGILCDHAAGTDDAVFPDGDTGHDDNTGTQPAVAANAHRQIVLQCLLPEDRINGMACGSQHHVGSQHAVIPDIDMGIIHQLQSCIDIHILAQMDMMTAPVTEVGRLHVGTLTHFCKKLTQQVLPLFKIQTGGAVIFVHKVQIRQLLTNDLITVGEIDITGMDFANVERKVMVQEEIQAPVQMGQIVGEIVYTCDGKQLGSVPIVSLAMVEKAGIWDYYGKLFSKYLL